MENDFESKRMFWSTLTYFIILLLFTLLRLASALGFLKFLPADVSNYLFTIITQIFILIIVPFTLYLFIFRQKPKKIMSSFMFKKVSGKTVGYSFLLGLVVFFIITFVASFFNTWLEVFGYEPFVGYATGEKTYANFIEFIFGVIFVAVLPGFCEEFSNRGMFLSGLTKGSTLRAVLMSGLLFGLMHLNINQFFYATVSGVIMAIVAIITKSIWPSIIVHFTNNAINTYLTYASENGLFGPELYDIVNLTIFDNLVLFKFLLYISFIAFVLFALVWLLYKLYINKKTSQYNQFVKELRELEQSGKLIDIENYNDLVYCYKTAKKYGVNPAQYIKGFENFTGNENVLNQPSSTKPVPISTLIKLFYNLIFTKTNKDYKPTFKENFFLYASIFLGAVITLFTFIWGLL